MKKKQNGAISLANEILTLTMNRSALRRQKKADDVSVYKCSGETFDKGTKFLEYVAKRIRYFDELIESAYFSGIKTPL